MGLPFIPICPIPNITRIPRIASSSQLQNLLKWRRPHVAQNVRHVAKMLIHFPHAFLHLICLLVVSAELPDYSELNNFLANHENVSYIHLKNFFKRKTGITENFHTSRLFPLCTSSSKVAQYSDLKNFTGVFRAMERAYDCKRKPLPYYLFNKSVHSTTARDSWISQIEITRINSPDEDARNMRQWMHITVRSKIKLEALYMQPIVGPMGLSSGQFSVEFTCQDIPATYQRSSKIDFMSLLIHCDYRSMAEINHPLAFFGGYRGGVFYDEFHVHYKWTDITCLETSYLQFVIIAIKTFNEHPKMGIDFQPLLSPIYTNFEFDSPDGVITPYHFTWNSGMTCRKPGQDSRWGKSLKLYHDTQFEKLKWEESTAAFRLPVNEDFDKCLVDTRMEDEAVLKKNPLRRECYPGPFHCPEELSFKRYSDSNNFSKLVDRRRSDFQVLVSRRDCLPCYFPTEEELIGPLACAEVLARKSSILSDSDSEYIQDYNIDYSELVEAPRDARVHGSLAMLAVFVLIPIANFLGRFYRGTTPVSFCVSPDLWIVLHIVLHIISWIVLWTSIGFVASSYEGISHAQQCYEEAHQSKNVLYMKKSSVLDALENCVNSALFPSSHLVVSCLTFVLMHVVLFMSPFRSSTQRARNVQIIMHSHLGHAVYIFFAVSLFMTAKPQCVETTTWSGLLIVTTIVAYLIAFWIGMWEDDKIGVSPRRYQWPILEHVRFPNPGPYYGGKIMVLVFYVCALFLFWILATVSLAKVSMSELQVLAGLTLDKTVKGMYSQCWRSNLTVEWELEA